MPYILTTTPPEIQLRLVQILMVIILLLRRRSLQNWHGVQNLLICLPACADSYRLRSGKHFISWVARNWIHVVLVRQKNCWQCHTHVKALETDGNDGVAEEKLPIFTAEVSELGMGDGTIRYS